MEVTMLIFLQSHFLDPIFVTAFLASSNGQDVPFECTYFASFQDAVENIKRMQQHNEYLHLQVSCNFARMLVSWPIVSLKSIVYSLGEDADPEDKEYNKAIIGSDAVDFHTLQYDLNIVHNYRHDTCIKLIINELSTYLQSHQYDVCLQYKNEMSVHFSTDHIKCVPQQAQNYATCTQCNATGDICANADTASPCLNGAKYCMTSVIQSKERAVVRKCAGDTDCKSNHIGAPECLLVDQGSLGFAYDCHFCCTGYNCNKGPDLIPPLNTFYNKTSS